MNSWVLRLMSRVSSLIRQKKSGSELDHEIVP
jgi:hypothetical protein